MAGAISTEKESLKRFLRRQSDINAKSEWPGGFRSWSIQTGASHSSFATRLTTAPGGSSSGWCLAIKREVLDAWGRHLLELHLMPEEPPMPGARGHLRLVSQG